MVSIAVQLWPGFNAQSFFRTEFQTWIQLLKRLMMQSAKRPATSYERVVVCIFQEVRLGLIFTVIVPLPSDLLPGNIPGGKNQPRWCDVFALFLVLIPLLIESHCAKKATIYQVTTMLATSENILFPGHNHLLTTGTDETPTLRLYRPSRQWVVCVVLRHMLIQIFGGSNLQLV